MIFIKDALCLFQTIIIHSKTFGDEFKQYSFRPNTELRTF